MPEVEISWRVGYVVPVTLTVTLRVTLNVTLSAKFMPPLFQLRWHKLINDYVGYGKQWILEHSSHF